MGLPANKRIQILELFARTQRPKGNEVQWVCLGKDISGNDIKTDLKNIVGTVHQQ